MGRVRSIVAKANAKLTVQMAASLLAGSMLLSSLLGLFRERLLNSYYLDTYPVGIDSYVAAFTIPDFMFVMLVSGALSVTFIPVFNQRLVKGNTKSAWELSSSMINLMALGTFIVSVLIIIFAEPLVRYVVAPGFDETGRNLAVSMMRVVAVNPLLFAVSAVITSMQQAIGRFTFYALAPMIYNVGIIIGTIFFTGGISIFGWQIFDGGIMGVALGVVLGSIMQLLVSSIGLLGLGFDYQFKIFWKNKGFRKVLRLLPPRSLDQGADYLNGIVEINLASRLGSGVVRSYQQATILHMVPINLIGVAISTAAFPEMTARLSEGRPDLFKKELQSVLRVIIWLAMPVAVISFFARGYLVNFLVNGGNTLIAGLFGALAVAILFRSIYYIAARSFYAQQDTKTPLYISIVAITLNITLAIWFTMSLGFGAYGLAWAQSIVVIVEVVMLFAVMSKRINGLFDKVFISAILRMMSATGFMGIICYITVLIFQLQGADQSFLASFPKFLVIVGVSALSYAAFSRLFKISEVNPIIRKVQSLVFGQVR